MPAEVKTREISFDKSVTQQQFFYFMDMSTLLVGPGDVVEYYFEVSDNDGVTGSKTTRSESHIFKIPTVEEISQVINETVDEYFEDYEGLIVAAEPGRNTAAGRSGKSVQQAHRAQRL